MLDIGIVRMEHVMWYEHDIILPIIQIQDLNVKHDTMVQVQPIRLLHVMVHVVHDTIV